VQLITSTLRRLRPGPYQLQAAIAAVHDEAPTAEATDWPQILARSGLPLGQAFDNPVVALNEAVAAATVHGPRTGLELLDALAGDARIATGHRYRAVRAIDQEHVRFPDPGDPSLRSDGGQCGELEDTERRPAQAGEVPEVGLGGHQAPHRCRTAHRVTPLRRRDDERVALGDRLAQKLHERRVDAWVRDPA
jgi:hypothetical protein